MNDTNYTIAKIISEKEYDGKTRFAFTTNETGEKVLSLFTKYPKNIRVGAQIYGHIEEQEKDGKVYFNFFFGKNPEKGGLSEHEKTSIALAVRQSSDALTEVRALRGELILSGALKERTSDGNEMPDFDPEDESLMQSAETAMTK